MWSEAGSAAAVSQVGIQNPLPWLFRCLLNRADTRKMTDNSKIHAIEVSDEAKLRWLERIDASEPNPASRIRDELERATATIDDATGALRWQTEDAVLVTDACADVVKTVLERGRA